MEHPKNSAKWFLIANLIFSCENDFFLFGKFKIALHKQSYFKHNWHQEKESFSLFSYENDLR